MGGVVWEGWYGSMGRGWYEEGVVKRGGGFGRGW